MSALNRINRLISCVALCLPLLLPGCAAPKFIYPPDPYELNHPLYLQAAPRIRILIAELQDTEKVHEFSGPEKVQDDKLLGLISQLCRNHHVPSCDLVGRVLISHGTGYINALKNPKLRPALLKQLEGSNKKEGASVNEFNHQVEQGAKFLTFAARTGYANSILYFRELGQKSPAIDMQPRAVTLTQQAYNKALIAHNEKMSKIGTAIVGAAIIGGAAALAANQGSGSPYPVGSAPTYSSYIPPDMDGDLRGCCSFHSGIKRDILGAEQCNILGSVLCNDGNPSPTCMCE